MALVHAGSKVKTGGKPGRSGLSRESILEAAVDILNEEGIDALSLRNIVKRLGCSVAGPYTYFKSQDEILSTLIHMGEEELTSDLRNARALGGNRFEILRRLAGTYRDFARRNREMHKLMFNIHGHNRIFHSATASYRVYLETIRSGVKAGEFKFSRQGYHALARTMWAWIYGMIVLEMTGVTAESEAVVDEGFAFFRKLLEQGE
ncbi:MAG: TetR/AcrR family transcriptional regulator [Leptospirales bacterium]|nr:TetR/AcrR family transcriptional regulator [Leptospirales bacterium]